MSDFIDLRIWKKKKICCGTIFVNALGEAIVDPRFLSPCQRNSHKIVTNPLMSFENIVTKELEQVQQTQDCHENNDKFKLPDRKERKDSEKSFESKFSSDQDEGYCDRSSCSPCFEESSTSSKSSTSSSSTSSSNTPIPVSIIED